MKRGITADRVGLTDLLEISDLLLRSEAFRFRVAGWSMYPALRKGDRITVEPASPAQLQGGDLILFHHQGRLVCHRLVAMDGTGPVPRIITKGDAVARCDEPLEPDQVLGRVVGVRGSGPWGGTPAMRIDRWREQLTRGVGQGLRCLQGRRSYRRVMRSLLSRCVAYYVGIPEGKRWYSYQRIPCGRGDAVLKGHQSFHLLAKLAGTCVASLHVEARAEGYWLQTLYVRIPYRGLGVASQLLALACNVAALSGAGVLLAAVEQENKTALRLFEKMGFRPPSATGSSSTSVLVRDLHRVGDCTRGFDFPDPERGQPHAQL